MNLTAQDKLCIPVPLYHCFGMVLGSLLCVSIGATMVFPGEVFDPEQTLRTASEERCTALHGVPTMFIAQLDLANFRDFDVKPLRTGIIAGSTCPVDLMNRLIKDMELTEIVIGYGQTECSPINTMTAIEDTFEQRVSTVGRAHYNWEQKIIREDGTTADVGEQGKLTAVDIRGFCQGQITHFKIPKHIKIVQEFPMTVTGKMQKFVMRDAMVEELENGA